MKTSDYAYLPQQQVNLAEALGRISSLENDFLILQDEASALTSQSATAEATANVLKEAPQSEELISLNYTWEYGGSEWDWEMTVERATYRYFQEIPRPPTDNYSVYVTHPSDDQYIDWMVEKIEQAAEDEGYDEYQTVEFAMAFVQSMPYTVDSVTSPFDEYPRYPIETLVDGGGDCEDTSILLASLLDSVGYSVVLLSPPEHMAVGVLGGENTYGSYWEYNGGNYYYVETTGPGWQIGELPDEYTDAVASIHSMEPVPIVTHDWNIEAQGVTYLLEVRVDNLGTATASDVYVYAGFDAGDGMVWSAEQSDVFDIESGYQTTVRLELLPPPTGENTRLIVKIVMGDYLVDENYSAWYDS